MKTNKVTTLPMQPAAINREGSGYAITSQSFKNWSPCGTSFENGSHVDKLKAFEGWDE
jgi:hypothetical protein